MRTSNGTVKEKLKTRSFTDKKKDPKHQKMRNTPTVSPTRRTTKPERIKKKRNRTTKIEKVTEKNTLMNPNG